MLPDAALPVPASLMTLLAMFSPLFTAPSFRTFTGLACGFLAQSGKRTVCGMLTGAGLSRAWPHDRAHYFFSRARWSPDDLGMCVAKLVIELLVGDGEPVEVLIDDTLFRRRGKKVWAASWFHDGSAQGPAKTGFGNNWVVLAVRVFLPMVSRPVAVPVMGRIAAGTPIEALQTRSHTISVPPDMLGSGEHYALEVRGDSMVEAGILDGDMALIQRNETAETGDIVVALIDEEEATLKRFRRRGASIALEPANTSYEVRILPPNRVKIQGKLIGLYRKY